MTHEPRLYSVRVDHEELCEITLEYDDYKTQAARDEVRSKIAVTYGIPRHYIRLFRKKGL